MEHRVPHDVGRELAKKATVRAFEEYSKKYAEYNPKTTWKGDYKANVAFSVKGMNLSGSIDVRDKEVALDLDVPFLLRPFKGTALEVIEREIKVWVQKAKNGELG